MNMKFIKSKNNYKFEALKDDLHPKQLDMVKEIWGEKYLEFDAADATDKIVEGKWELSEEDKYKALNSYFQTNIKKIKEDFEKVHPDFVKALISSIPDRYEHIKSVFEPITKLSDMNTSALSQLYESVFMTISTKDTLADKVIKKDSSGRPVKDENDKMVFVEKQPGEIVYAPNQLTNIIQFVSSWNATFPDKKVDVNFSNDMFTNIKSFFNNRSTIGEFNIFSDEPVYLYITSKPKDILNISVSKFYTSCQDLYTGGYRRQVLSNVFDPNTKPAFIIYDTPYFDKDNTLISDFMPICRKLIRNMEPFSQDSEYMGLYFDRCYPDRMEIPVDEIIEKYSGNKKNNNVIANGYYANSRIYKNTYKMSFDLPSEEMGNLSTPYHDRLRQSNTFHIIGKNTKRLYFNRNTDYTKYVISPTNKVEEIIIETGQLPENFFENDFPLLKWIKIKFMKINNIEAFKMIKDGIALYKCEINSDFINEIYQNAPDMKKISLSSIKMEDVNMPDIYKDFKKLEYLELSFVYKKLNECLLNMTSLKELVLSSDVLEDKDNKILIDKLKKKKIKINFRGLVL
jgi:hypothetical protein